MTQDAAWMQRALDLAAATVGLTSPNPQVGCVLLAADGALAGEGAHRYAERDHAEIVALKAAAQAGRSVVGGTAYVTLEPCAHHGRTGPCAEALAAAGLKRCVVATVDPNPLVRGGGLAKLRAAGVTVELLSPASEQAQAARRMNDAFVLAVQLGRPMVTLKAAVSVDGALAPAPGLRSTRAPVWLTGTAARADVQRLRHEHDALLTGIGTVLTDDPALSDRTGAPRRRPLLRVVLDRHLRLPLAAKLVREAAADLLVITTNNITSNAAQEAEAPLRAAGVEVVRMAETQPAEVLAVLQARGIRSVLLEAGSAMNGSFLAAGLVDRVVLYYSEIELGAGAVPFAAGQPSPYVLEQRLQRVERSAFAHDTARSMEDVRITGDLRDPWAGVA